MKSDSGNTVSIWMETTEVPTFPCLTANVEAEVCIVGAGIAGLSTAYLLAREGKEVVVLDDGPIGGGETCRTTAHLVNALDDRFFELERMHGERGAQLAAESHTAAIAQIEYIVQKESIYCDFMRLDGYLFVPPGQPTDILDQELEAVHRAGLQYVEKVSRAPIPSFDTGPCLRFPNQAQFHPMKYLVGLAKAIQAMGGRIFTGTHASSIKGGTPARVESSLGWNVSANAVVVATNTPVNDRVTMHTKQAPYRTYVIGARIPRGSIPFGLYWDTADPYHYIRLQRVNSHAQNATEGHDVLIIGGEDHKTGQKGDTEAPYGQLETWAKERFPMIEKIEFRWSGQIIEPVDGLAFIGRNPMDEENVFIATGDSGNGMTHGTIAGMLLRDLILGRSNEWSKLYDPGRKTLKAAGEFARENLNVAARYGEWMTGSDVHSLNEIPLATGAVVRKGMSKVAIYRDDNGRLHEMSAVCPHLGCIVHWNSVEKTWDCPCHGSRYDCYGHVINGPAITNLGKVNEETEIKTNTGTEV